MFSGHVEFLYKSSNSSKAIAGGKKNPAEAETKQNVSCIMVTIEFSEEFSPYRS